MNALFYMLLVYIRYSIVGYPMPNSIITKYA